MIRLRAVGECVIDVGGERVGPDAELAFALLLVLTLADGRPLGRRQLIDLLWPATTEARARHNLRQALYKLRQLGVPVETESNRLRLPAAAIAPNVLLEPELEGPPPAELLRPDVPFGEFLAGYAPAFSAPFAAWVDEQRGVMHGRLRRAVLALLLDERRRGSWGAVETLARKCLQLDPLNEEATLALAEATALSGSKRAALAILDGYLHELGGSTGDIRLPATVLRRRIAERLHPTNSYVMGESCFLGRAESVAFLNGHFRATRELGGRAVLLWGDAGIGKSRLLTEFGRMATLEGAQVVRVGCQPRDVERPLSVFVDAVPLILALPGALGVAPESLEYLRRLTAHDPAVLEPSAATREAELLFASVRRAVFDLVDAVAAEAPLLLCFEDLQWLDDQSWRVLRELIGWLEGRPVLVALSSRLPHATPAPPAREAPGLEAHRVMPLDQASSVALLDAITAGTEPPAAFRDWSIQVADGNPLLLRLLGGHWLEKGQMQAPASIERLIKERIDQLPPFPRLILQTCALFGKHATLSRLRDVLGTEPDVLLAGLQVLEERNLIGGDAGGTCCRHALIVSAAVTTMSPVTATALARCAAGTLQRDLESSHSVAELWQCAHLWIRAGDRARAIRVIRSCASHLLTVGLPEDALDVYKEALTLFDSQDDKIALLSGMKVPLLLTSRWRELIDTLDALVALRGPHHQASDDTSDEVLRIEAYWHVCDEEEGEPLIARLLSSASSSAVMAAHRLKAVALALTIADNFCLADAMSSCFQLLRPLARGPQIDPAFALQSDVVYHTSRGDIRYAAAQAQELIALGRYRADQHLLAKYLRFASVPLRRNGRFVEAEECLTEAIDISSRLGAQQAMLIAVESLIIALLEQSKVDEADIWLRHALDLAPSYSKGLTPLGLRVLDARLALIHGRPQEAKIKLDLPESALSLERMTRRRAGLASVAALVAVESSDLVDLKTPQSILAESFAITAGWGGQDFTAFAYLRIVELTQGFLDAQNAAHTYLTRDRREQFPPPIEITRYSA